MISVKKNLMVKQIANFNIPFLASTIVQTSCTTVYCFLEEQESNVPYFLSVCSFLVSLSCLLHAAACNFANYGKVLN